MDYLHQLSQSGFYLPLYIYDIYCMTSSFSIPLNVGASAVHAVQDLLTYI